MTIDLNTLLIVTALMVFIGVIVFFASSLKAKAKHGDTEISIDTKREKDSVTTRKIADSDVTVKTRTGQNVNVDEVKNSNINIS
jgi:hypothetical protein